MIVVPGSASKTLAHRIAEISGIELANIVVKRFPDKECHVRINRDLTDEEVLLVQNAYPDENIVELFLLQDAIREFKIKKLTVLIPYFGYARQDKKFEEGEAISARAVAKRIQVDADEVMTVDIHNVRMFAWFNIPVMDISPAVQIGNYLKKFKVDVIIAPDDGALDKAKATAEAVGCEYDYLEKTRLNAEHVKMTPKAMHVSNKNIAIVDDIISTGGTIVTAAKCLKEQGAKKIYAACTHGLFVGNALERLNSACNGIFSTDTVENETSVVSVSESVKTLIV